MKRTPFRSKPKPMKKVSDKRRSYWASPEGKAEYAYMGDVKKLPCVICGKEGPSDAHHCYHDRYGTRKESGYDTIPLCGPHHKVGPEAIHNGKDTWRKKHGPDHGYIKQTREAVRRMRNED